MAPRALFAGPGAARTMIAGRSGVVELALSRGAYLRFERDWVLLADPSAPFGPLSVAATGLHFGDLAGAPVDITTSRLVIGPTEISLERLRLRGPPRCGGTARGVTEVGATGTATAAATAAAAAAALAAALAALPEPPRRLRPGIDMLAAGRIRDSVRALAGLGEGLTPEGDDVLAGAAATLFRSRSGADGSLSTLADGRASPIGLAYLRCAERGELPDGAAQLLCAIRRGSPADVAAALTSVRSWGASSGTALAWGICAAVLATSTPARRST